MPDTPAVDTAKAVFQSIAVDQIKPSRHQARKDFDEEGIKGLAESMRAEGLLQPITVREAGLVKREASNEVVANDASRDTRYELISGERRLRAAKLLGWTSIDAKVIKTVSEGEAAAKGLIENIQRDDLNPIEEAEGFAELNRLDPTIWTQAKIAQIAGKTQSHISETLRLLKLSDKVKDNIRRRIIKEGHAVELLRLPSQQLQDKVADRIKKKDLGVRETRAVVNKLLKTSSLAGAGRGYKDSPPSESFKFSGKAMDAWVTFSGHYPIIGNWDDFVVNLKKAFDAWRANGIKRGKKTSSDSSASSANASSHSLSSAISALSPEEVASLEDIAKDGPGPIYAKLLPGTPLAKMMEHSKWSDFGAKDVKDGLPLMLKALKENSLAQK